jgi:hypothetical protein
MKLAGPGELHQAFGNREAKPPQGDCDIVG